MRPIPSARTDQGLGVILLVHSSLARAAQVARHWAESGCPLVIHVDKAVSAEQYAEFESALAGLPDVLFSPRLHCEWGKWSIVRATQTAAEMMLESFPDVRHVFLASGSCLPLRPVADLRAYLERRPQTDFIESANVEEVPWIVGGLGQERFTLRFPFSWKKQRRLFDAHVAPSGGASHAGPSPPSSRIPGAGNMIAISPASGSRMNPISRPWRAFIRAGSKAVR